MSRSRYNTHCYVPTFSVCRVDEFSDSCLFDAVLVCLAFSFLHSPDNSVGIPVTNGHFYFQHFSLLNSLRTRPLLLPTAHLITRTCTHNHTHTHAHYTSCSQSMHALSYHKKTLTSSPIQTIIVNGNSNIYSKMFIGGLNWETTDGIISSIYYLLQPA